MFDCPTLVLGLTCTSMDCVLCSRVVNHRHSPADVTAGALIGTVIGALFFIRLMHDAPERRTDKPSYAVVA
jgi:membrane-associated phospholipid phosphatase